MSRRIWLTLLTSTAVVAITTAAASPTPARFARSDGLPPPTRARIDSLRSLTPRIGPLGPQAPCLVVPRSDPAAVVETASEPVTSTWQFEAPMPTARHSFGAATLPGTTDVYALGGMLGLEAVTAAERYNACSNSWDTLAPLPEPRGFVSAAELNGKIYLVGGVDRITSGDTLSGTFSVFSSTWVYDPQANAWSPAAYLPVALGGVAVAAANGRLYAFGGFDARGPGEGDVDTTYEYDPLANAWLTRAAILSGTRSLAAAAVSGGKIYLAGGVTGGWSYGGATLSSVNVYDPGTDTWTNAAPLKDSLHSLGLTTAPDGYLYAVGGGLAWYSMVAAERYDPLVDTWTYLPDAFHDYERAGAAAVYTSGRLFLVGGTSRAYEVTTSSVESLRLFDDFCRSGLRSEPDAIAPGERITYTIQLRSGDVTLTAASLTDPIPAGTAFGGFEQQPSGVSFNAAQNRVEWSGGLLAHQAPITIRFGVVAAEAGWVSGQLITNTVTFGDGAGLTFDRSSVTRLEFFDLSPSAKRVHPLETPSGGSLTYTLRVQNGSSHTGTASLVDPIPLNASYIPDSLTASTGSASYAAGSVVWSGELPQWATHTNTSGDYEWGDSRGGGTLPGVKYEWIEISETGRQMGFYSPNYGRCYPVPFPFGFNFYGTHYSESAVQIDGTLFFMQPNEGLYMGPNNTPIPSATGYSGNRFIAAFWDDLYLAPGGLYYQVLGTSPRRRVVIEYHETSRLDGSRHLGTPGDWQIVLYEGSSIILLQYKDVDFGIPGYDEGASATIGIQDTPSHGLQYSYNTPALSDGLAILFLPPGQSVPYPIDYADIRFAVRTASPLADRTPITNTATMTDSSGRLIALQAVALARGPDMASSFQTIEPSAPYPGDEVTVTIYVRNSGALDGEALVSDAIPAGLLYVKNSLSWETGFGRVVNGLLTWSGNIWAGTQSPLRFRAKVAGNATHNLVITNTAVVTNVFAGISHPAQASVTVQKPADVYVGQVGAGTLEWPETLVYTITYGNAGPFATDVPLHIVDRLPAGATYVGSSPGGLYDALAHRLTWDVGALASGASGTLTATLDVPVGVPPLTVLANAVSVEALAQDANAANDAQDWFTVVGSPVNLLNYTAKTLAPQAISPGSVVSYTIVIANTGRAGAAARITDTLPAGASYVPGSSWLEFPSNLIELYNPAGNRIEWSGEVPAGGTARLGFRVIIRAASGSRVTNTVTIDDGAGLVFERGVTTPPVRRVLFVPLILRGG